MVCGGLRGGTRIQLRQAFELGWGFISFSFFFYFISFSFFFLLVGTVDRKTCRKGCRSHLFSDISRPFLGVSSCHAISSDPAVFKGLNRAGLRLRLWRRNCSRCHAPLRDILQGGRPRCRRKQNSWRLPEEAERAACLTP